MITIHSVIRILYVLGPAEMPPQTLNNKTLPVKFTKVPANTEGEHATQWLKERYLDALAPFIHEAAMGAEDLRTFLHINSADVTSKFGGSWSDAITQTLADKAARNQIAVHVHKDPILSWEHFKEASSVSGMRNKVKAIDDILKRPSMKIPGGILSRKDHSNIMDLEALLAACDTYLGDRSRESSGRRPAVEALRRAVVVEVACRKVTTGDWDKVKNYFEQDKVLMKARDRAGYTALGRAIYGGDREDQVTQMLAAGFDPNARQSFEWRPIDVARAMNCPKIERILEAKVGIKTACRAVTARATIDALEEATLGPTRDPVRSVKAGLTKLYENALFRPILDLAAKDARVARAAGHWSLRLFYMHNYTVGELPYKFRSSAGAGNYEPKNNSMGWCGKADHDEVSIFDHLEKEDLNARALWQLSMEGTLIHELTHFCALKVWQNNALPYPKFDPGKLTATEDTTDAKKLAARRYYEAYRSDLKNPENKTILDDLLVKQRYDHVDQCGIKLTDSKKKLSLLYFTLIGHVLDYRNKYITKELKELYTHDDAEIIHYKQPKAFSEGVGQEIVSHLSQSIHYFGQENTAIILPATFAWYRDTFLPAVRTAVTA